MRKKARKPAPRRKGNEATQQAANSAGLLSEQNNPDNQPLSSAELDALAEITAEDMARAAADWDLTSGAPGLLDAKQVSAVGTRAGGNV